MHKTTRLHRRITRPVATLTIAAALTACGTVSSPRGELGLDKQLLAACDHARPPASLVELDVSGSSQSNAILGERMAAVESIVRATAICGGSLRVAVFAASSADTTPAFDGALHLDGATDNARLKRAPRLVTETMAKIRRAYGPAVKATPGGASDITAVYRLGAEWIAQLGRTYRLHLTILTDGLQNVGIKLGGRALTRAQAAALAAKTNVPRLAGASVTVAGLGRVAGSPPPSRVVEGLVVFYTAICHKAGAASCTSVTDYATGGK
jgi:hypothetical protein